MRIAKMTSQLATQLEEYGRKNDGGVAAACLAAVLSTTVADRLWTPFQFVVYNPAVAAIGLVVLYVVFCVVFTPLLLLSYVVTSYGSFASLVALVVVGARALARSISFPGSTLSIQREMSADFMRRLLGQLDSVAKQTATLTSTLMLVATGRIPRADFATIARKLDEVRQHVEGFPYVVAWLTGAAEELAQRPRDEVPPVAWVAWSPHTLSSRSPHRRCPPSPLFPGAVGRVGPAGGAPGGRGGPPARDRGSAPGRQGTVTPLLGPYQSPYLAPI